jgi:hypothetical protein
MDAMRYYIMGIWKYLRRFLPDVHLDGKYPEMSGDNPKSGIFPR